MNYIQEQPHQEQLVSIPTGSVQLKGNLVVPEGAQGIILFAHGSGSSRHSPRNRYVAQVFNAAGLATLLLDLLSTVEERIDRRTRHLRFDIDLLATRLIEVTDWLAQHSETKHYLIGYFGASTGAGAALVAAAKRPELVKAIVSRGGRPDLAGQSLERVQAPTLLIVGGRDIPVIKMNRSALNRISTVKCLEIVPDATHLFEEPGTLAEVAQLASQWFQQYVTAKQQQGATSTSKLEA